jgi:hypothetical protein
MAHLDNSSDTVVVVKGDDKVVNQGNDKHSGDDTSENNDDSITGVGTDGAINGIVNSDVIDTGKGKDSITGQGIRQGAGILNTGTIDTGKGKDSITGIGDSSTGVGIENEGIINTGNGKDEIIGEGFIGILNNGTIDTGRGKDIVDALIGGFDGNGSVFLGRGDDTLSGFGTGFFYGGKGTDTLILPLESYTVGFIDTDDGRTFVTFTLGDFTMNTIGFESLIVGDTVYNFDSLTTGAIIGGQV